MVGSVISQLPVLTVDVSNQPVHISQLPVLVVYIENQPLRISQLPVMSVVHNKPVPFPLPIVPEVPVTETWQWKTAITVADGSREQRSALRSQPRYGMSFNALIQSEADRRDAYNMLFSQVGKVFDYPNYVYSTKLTGSSDQGTTRLYFDPAATDIRAGESLALFDSSLVSTRLVTVASLEADGADLAEPLDFDVLSNWLVCPALRWRVGSSAGLSMRSVAGDFGLQMISDAPRIFQRPGAAPVITKLDNIIVLDQRPLADNDVDESFVKRVNWLDNEIAPAVPYSRWPIPFVSGKRSYLIHRPAGVDYWRSVADQLRGQQKTFLLPTFRNDLPLISIPALGSSVLVTSNIQFLTFWNQRTYRYIQIMTANGTIYRRVLEVTANYDLDGNPTSANVRLATALGAVAGDNVISSVSYMNICRQDSDEITLVHGPVDSVITISVRAVNE